MKFRKKGEQTQEHTVIEAYQTTIPMTIHTLDGVTMRLDYYRGCVTTKYSEKHTNQLTKD